MNNLALLGGTPVRSKTFPSWPNVNEFDQKVIQEVTKSGIWAYVVQANTFGPKNLEFMSIFAENQTAKYAFLVSNGSAALEIALQATGIGPGDEVIVPPLTFLATAVAVIHVGAVPVFADVDPETYCLDTKAVSSVITPRTKAIIPVHLGCCLADMDELLKIAENHNLIVIEDCAHVAGAKWRDHGVGSLGQIGCFSFQLTKPLTCGEGGAVITSDDHLQESCHAIINCGRVRQEDKLTEVPLGWNYRVSEFQAAILLSQFAKLESQMRVKEENVQLLLEGISDIQWLESVRLDERVSKRQYYYFTLRYHEEEFENISRDLFVKALNAEGVPTYYGYTPVYREPLFVDLESKHIRMNPYQRDVKDFSNFECPVAEKASTKEAINIYHSVLMGSKEDMNAIIEAIHKIDINRSKLKAYSESE